MYNYLAWLWPWSTVVSSFTLQCVLRTLVLTALLYKFWLHFSYNLVYLRELWPEWGEWVPVIESYCGTCLLYLANLGRFVLSLITVTTLWKVLQYLIENWDTWVYLSTMEIFLYDESWYLITGEFSALSQFHPWAPGHVSMHSDQVPESTWHMHIELLSRSYIVLNAYLLASLD